MDEDSRGFDTGALALQAIAGWMNSPPHRANIMRGSVIGDRSWRCSRARGEAEIHFRRTLRPAGIGDLHVSDHQYREHKR